MSARTNLLVIATAALLASCGGEEPEDTGGVTTGPEATATASPAPTGEATATPTAEPSPTETAEPEEDAGDEDGNRVEVQLDLEGDGIAPARLEVPAFLGLRVRLRNRTGVVQPVTLDGEALTSLPPGEETEVDVEGLRPGDHVLEAAGSGRATLVAVRAGE